MIRRADVVGARRRPGAAPGQPPSSLGPHQAWTRPAGQATDGGPRRGAVTEAGRAPASHQFTPALAGHAATWPPRSRWPRLSSPGCLGLSASGTTADRAGRTTYVHHRPWSRLFGSADGARLGHLPGELLDGLVQTRDRSPRPVRRPRDRLPETPPRGPFFLYVPFRNAAISPVMEPSQQASGTRTSSQKEPADRSTPPMTMVTPTQPECRAAARRRRVARPRAKDTLVDLRQPSSRDVEGGNWGKAAATVAPGPSGAKKRTLSERGEFACRPSSDGPGTCQPARASNEIVHMTEPLLPSVLAAAGTVPEPAWKIDEQGRPGDLDGPGQSPTRRRPDSLGMADSQVPSQLAGDAGPAQDRDNPRRQARAVRRRGPTPPSAATPSPNTANSPGARRGAQGVTSRDGPPGLKGDPGSISNRHNGS